VTQGPGFRYLGRELSLFAAAANWKRYWASQIRPYLGCRVLEVGGGLGENVGVLVSSAQQRWVCLEPDPGQALAIARKLQAGELPACCEVRESTVEDLAVDEAFDTILYIDVLEHIQDDRAELAQAAGRLDVNGKLVVLSPAHRWLFSAFDAAIGHHRRYGARQLKGLVPDGLSLVRLRYLDALGICASLANRCFLRRGVPTEREIRLWDRILVPLSRRVDPLLGYRVGKSLLAVWEKLPFRQ